MKPRDARAKPDVGAVLFALADPTRRHIFERLGHGPSAITALSTPLGVTVTAVRQHIHVLEACRLVSTEKIGRERVCRIEPAGLKALAGWLERQRSRWARRLDLLEDILNEEDDA